MTKRYSVLMCVSLLVFGVLLTPVQAHSDVAFRYVGSKIEVELSDEGTWVFEGEFPLDGVERQFTSEPGFASEVAEGLGIGPQETIVYNVLSGLMFWDGASLTPAASGTQLRVNHLVPDVPDTLISASSGVQMGVIADSAASIRNLVGLSGAAGDLHEDLKWFLEPNVGPASAPPPALGAYGVLLSLSTSAAGIQTSEPIALVFNFGLEESAFEAGVGQFAAMVPEPAGFGWMVTALVGLVARRRRAR